MSLPFIYFSGPGYICSVFISLLIQQEATHGFLETVGQVSGLFPMTWYLCFESRITFAGSLKIKLLFSKKKVLKQSKTTVRGARISEQFPE